MLSPITEGIWVSGAFLAQPFANGALMVALLIFMILGVDFLNNQRKKWLLGGIPIVGDVPHLWRRLNTKPVDHRTLFQFGYDTVWHEAKAGQIVLSRSSSARFPSPMRCGSRMTTLSL
jgi:hypothetical protein